MKHVHHIVPKHMGGTDDSSNLVELTIEEHAEAHKKLYEEYGMEEDKIAWLGLSGQIGKEEIVKRVLSEAGKKSARMNKEIQRESGRKTGLANKGRVPWNKGKKMSEEFRETLRTSSKVKPPSRKGAKHSEETKERMRAAALNRKKNSGVNYGCYGSAEQEVVLQLPGDRN